MRYLHLVIFLLASSALAGVDVAQIKKDSDISYWKNKLDLMGLSGGEVLAPDSMVQKFILAPPDPLQCDSLTGEPLKLARRKQITIANGIEYGWLWEVPITYEALPNGKPYKLYPIRVWPIYKFKLETPKNK